MNIPRAVDPRANEAGQTVKNSLLILSVFAIVFSGCDSTAPPATFMVQINNHSFQVELAQSVQSQSQGLAGRDHLAQDAGMLFVWPDPTIVSMWMKGCKIPLDVLFFDHNKRLINFHTMAAPSPGQADYSLPLYRSDKPAQYALEIRAGTSGRLHIKPGTAISFSPELLKALGKETE